MQTEVLKQGYSAIAAQTESDLHDLSYRLVKARRLNRDHPPSPAVSRTRI